MRRILPRWRTWSVAAFLLGSFCCLSGCRDDGGAKPQTDARCDLTANNLAFDSVRIGECSPAESLTISNPGSTALDGVIASPCPEFQIMTGAGPFSLAGGALRTVTIRYCPTAAVSETCLVTTGLPQCPVILCIGVGRPIPPPGVCCDLFSGACRLVQQEECAAPAVWRNDWTNCNPNPCLPTGGCCKDANCTLTTQGDCFGVWQGVGSSCLPNPCLPLEGACCAVDGSCSLLSAAACVPPNVWHGAVKSCDPNPCPEPERVCCEPDGTCSLTTQADCPAPGDWHPEESRCSPNPCPGPPPPEGACCAPEGSCLITLRAACASPGLWHGAWTACDPNPCPQPLGACCVPNGTCNLTTDAGCLAPRVWQGDGTICSPNPCPRPTTGACCHESRCAINNQYDCEGQGGTYLGDEALCTPCVCIPCPRSPLDVYAAEDVTVSSGTSIPGACQSAYDRVGFDPDGSGKLSALFLFDLSAIPPCATVTNAGLEFFGDGCDPPPASARVEFEISTLSADWSECGATWNSAPGSALPDPCRGTLYCAPPAYFGAGCLDLLGLVQGWVDDPASNHGIRIDPINDNDGAARIHSRRHTEGLTRPKLVLSFTCPPK